MTKHKALTLKQAIAAEKEMRRLEADPKVTKRELRLYMQSSMPCGHAVGNLLTCDGPPNGCVMCLTARRGTMPNVGAFILRAVELGIPGSKAHKLYHYFARELDKENERPTRASGRK